MKIAPIKCTGCGANLEIVTIDGVVTCEYCGTHFKIDTPTTEKAVDTINIPLQGNTVFIVQSPMSPVLETTDYFYKVRIRRKKSFNGFAIYYEFDINGKILRLENGGTISFETNLKEPCFHMIEKCSFGESNPISAQLTFIADGLDVDISVAIDASKFGNMLHIKLIKSSNKTVRFS